MKYRRTDCSQCKKYQIGTCRGTYKMYKGGLCDIFEQKKEEQMENVITYQKPYEEYRQELGNELTKAAESFVRIGYLLKVARDTDVLANSQYETVVDFAKAEFGLDKTQVSRFMSINDKFAVNGYGDCLEEKYRGFGYAKLVIMLQLPDAVNENLTPDYSKAEIQAIKDEVDEEKKITDIEVMLEDPTAVTKEYGKARYVIYQLGDDNPEMFMQIAAIPHKERMGETFVQTVQEIMAPDGTSTYSVRIKGVGRIMLMLSDTNGCSMVNVRSGEDFDTSWEDIATAWDVIIGDTGLEPKARWSAIYCRILPQEEKKEEVAPVQPKKKPTKVAKAPKPKQETLHDIEKSIPEPAPVEEKKPETVVKTECEEDSTVDEQVPGQTSVEDFPELLPDNTKTEHVESVDVTGKEPATEEADTSVQSNTVEAGTKALSFDKTFLHQARNSISNLNTAMTVGNYNAALADTMNANHYLRMAMLKGRETEDITSYIQLENTLFNLEVEVFKDEPDEDLINRLEETLNNTIVKIAGKER